MKFSKNRLRLFYLSSIFLIFNFISKVVCLIELPIIKIKPTNIPKYPDFNPNTEIPENIMEKNLKKNKNFKNNTKINK